MAFELISGGKPTQQPRLASLTPAQQRLRGTPLKQIGWVRYPDGLGRVFQAVDYPRLTFITRQRGEDLPESFWLVDGLTVVDLDEAAERLDVPPVLSAEELEVLDLVPAEWSTPDDLRAAVTAGLSQNAAYERVRLLRTLNDKGFLEPNETRIRRRSLSATG